MKQILIAAIMMAFISCNKTVEKPVTVLPACDKCGYVGCIYERIDAMTDGSDQSTYDAILYMAKKMNLTEAQFELLVDEYHL